MSKSGEADMNYLGFNFFFFYGWGGGARVMPAVKEGTFDKNSLTRLTLLIMSSTLLLSPLIMLSIQPLYQGQARRGRG